jgi:hypothetical protein
VTEWALLVRMRGNLNCTPCYICIRKTEETRGRVMNFLLSTDDEVVKCYFLLLQHNKAQLSF